ncbi:enoyl-CoA hydratase/isomerase family protein [Mycobacterium sp. CBMA293]|uniref:enoyl-CoA hydratase/isomerase family protein n=1 Tax=unclassified Mycolicibacterium TaxID=2636767 RepID=UPI0012DF08FE|nr:MULTISPECIES: enoyl-CoA hydratase/isomerase family protein [unclassified Mycolicibacterium]MUL49429.1 enoyl-CoA hydratase/isomerase family protein [Mycolicibacterium sp. CBMA 360]MUL57207.1 enoyl-CoA hydratase/isomerase family protein [Mycolicibacterium sp. CBMA 335]MUL70247.1 enoyl-CoA hydratase/isomerase family protein [Mycolicibacterium sp. CBMA 311]MUL92295.1 enoyl-CoA hydratase/isomerase family protein [Mycolicibacterium sp. CBMA 230]MUM06716.1 enoyl-CoA hydratase [Mycolicibacterium sp
MRSSDKVHYDLPAELTVTAEGPVRIITLNRPDDLNGANRSMHQGLARLWPQLAADESARVVILTGAGTAFSAGGDFGYMQENIDDEMLRAQTMNEGRAIVEGMVRCPLPVIAAVNGPAVGLGASLAVMCDLVLMAEGSFLADPHLRMGLVPGDGGMTWPALTGLMRAKEYLFLGSRIPAADAVQLGLATRVVPADDLRAEALRLAHRLAGIPATALRDTKRALNSYLEVQLDGAYERALTAELACLHSEEHRAAVAAAMAKSSG